MAHFAKLDSNKKVIAVEVVDNSNLLDGNGDEQESIGIQYLITHTHIFLYLKELRVLEIQ